MGTVSREEDYEFALRETYNDLACLLEHRDPAVRWIVETIRNFIDCNLPRS